MSSASGVKGANQIFDTQRRINEINQEYRENIRNGMSEKEATQIRNSKIGSEIGNLWINQEEAYNESKREKAMKKREILQEAIMQRGYNQMEANYLSRCVDLAEVDANNPSSVNLVLDLYHIAYKEPSSKDSFFNDGSDVTKPVLEDKPTIVEEVPAPQPIVDERANAVKAISETVLNSYALNNVELSDIQKADLDQVANNLNKYEDVQIIIIGHTCNIGSQEVNQNIGERRAKTAKNYLMSKGVSGNRIQIESRDFSEPVAENDTEDHRRQNRRITFIVK
jgi:outer membrane protein OmpA-like peptidoglycan-associated protein